MLLRQKLESKTSTQDHTARKVGWFLLHTSTPRISKSKRRKGTRLHLVQTSEGAEKETEARVTQGAEGGLPCAPLAQAPARRDREAEGREAEPGPGLPQHPPPSLRAACLHPDANAAPAHTRDAQEEPLCSHTLRWSCEQPPARRAGPQGAPPGPTPPSLLSPATQLLQSLRWPVLKPSHCLEP